MTFHSFDQAKAACGPDQTVAGVVLKDRSVAYVNVDSDADSLTMAELAFKIRHGREMTEAEKLIEREAQRLAFR